MVKHGKTPEQYSHLFSELEEHRRRVWVIRKW